MSIASVVLLLSLGMVAYTLIGYPLLLGFLSRMRPRVVARNGPVRSVTAIVAVYNGGRFLRAKLECLLGLNYPRELLDIIVVSDGSTDNTDAVAQEFSHHKVCLLRVPRNGKPAALNAAIAQAKGELLFMTDVRQQMDPDCLIRLTECFGDESVGVASGELVILAGATQGEENIGLYRRYENWIRDALARIDSIFGATGSIYLMRRDLASPMPADALLDDMHLPLGAFFRGYRLIFIPESKAYDYPTALDSEFHRKVRTLAGNIQIMLHYPMLSPRNRLLFHFASYKLARLLLPWALIAAAVSSCFLKPPFSWIALGGQACFYLLAGVDPVVPQGWFLKRLTSVIRTFVVLMLASLFAVSIFFVNPRDLWRETKVAGPR